MEAIRYDKSLKALWDSTVEASANGTFLLLRDYMDYHADRFADASLLFRDTKGRCLGLLPANIVRHTAEEGGTLVISHGGLTYGGLILSPGTTAVQTGEMLAAAAARYARDEGASRLIYKAIPHIYHRMPASADLYHLFRMGARRTACGLSTAVEYACPAPTAALRRRCIRKARTAGVTLHEAQTAADRSEAWAILEEVLRERHATRPVHRLAEIELLRGRFPERIRFHLARHKGRAVAMCVVYATRKVAHTQYIAANDEGRSIGALDLLLGTLIGTYAETGARYFDFGISTEDGGNVLNEGLIAQKEGFGGRSVCYETYTLDLAGGDPVRPATPY